MKSKLKISDVSKLGGVVSDVLEGKLEHKGQTHSVVVKRTRKKVEAAHFSYSDTELKKAAPRTHALDRQILKRLQNYVGITVPILHMSHSKGLQTVMADFNFSGYTFMQDRLVDGTLPAGAAAETGHMLAELQLALADKNLMRGIKPVEDSKTQVRERLAEAHILLYGNLAMYRELEAKLLHNDGLLYTDGHPKNMAVNDSGKVMLFDFGRLINGSVQYPAPNFLAHIGLSWIGGTMPADKARVFIGDCYAAYNKVTPIEEEWFVRFFASELVHRGLAMRWIDPRLFRDNRKVKARLAAHAVFLDVFEANYSSLNKLLDSLQKHSNKLA